MAALAADGCLFGRLTGNKLRMQLQRISITAEEHGPQSGLRRCLFEALTAEAVEGLS